MNLRIGFAVMAIWTACGGVLGDEAKPAHERSLGDGKPLREAYSENQKFHLRITPGRGAGRHVVGARGELSRTDEKGESERRVWRGRLANDVAPMTALIRDDGRFTATLDEHQRGGAAHALVIYDERGRALREFGLRELLRGDDWKQVEVKRKAVEWLSGAKFSFADNKAEFVIRLKWGREIRINLEKPGVVGVDEKSGVATDSLIPPEVLALLDAAGSQSNAEGNEQMTSKESVDEAALEALRQIAATFGLDLDMAEAAVGALMKNARATENASDAIDGVKSDTTEKTAEDGSDSSREYVEAGGGVPLPDPENPVDYVAWALAQTEVVGENAAPLYEQACAQYQEFEGDQAQLDAALRGDREALASPEIASWMALHDGALDLLHAAPEHEYHGLLKLGDEYSVVGLILPNLSPTRKLARVSLVRAKMYEAGGDLGAAMGEYANTLAVGSQISQGSTIIENLVGAAIQREMTRGLLESFAADAEDAIDYAAAARVLEEKYRPLRPIVEVMAGERACCFDVLQRVYEPDPTTGGHRVSEDGARWVGDLFNQDTNDAEVRAAFRDKLSKTDFEDTAAEANRYYDDLAEACNLPFQDARRALSAAEERISSPEFTERNPVFSGLLPSFSRLNHITTQARATRNAVRLVANLKAYRREHGVYPASLDVFGDSDMVVDPFTGVRFAYCPDGGDFTLYSLGGNGVDDGGVHGKGGFENDVRYWPPPKEE